MLDRMGEDLTQSKRAMRVINSPFGGIKNYFARDNKKDKRQQGTKPSSSGSKGTHGGYQSSGSSSLSQYESTGNEVDDNLDEIARGLAEMKRVGLEIGNQLDHSIDTIDELQYKVTDRDQKLTHLNKNIGKKIR